MSQSWEQVKKLLDDPYVSADTKEQLLLAYHHEHVSTSFDNFKLDKLPPDFQKYADQYNLKGDDLGQFGLRQAGLSTDNLAKAAKDESDEKSYHDRQQHQKVTEGQQKLDEKQPPGSGSAAVKTSDELLEAAQPALEVFKNFIPVDAKVPGDTRSAEGPLDFGKDIQTRFDEQKGINFQKFLDEAEKIKAAYTTMSGLQQTTETKLNSLYKDWSGDGANASYEKYSKDIAPNANKLLTQLEETPQVIEQAVQTVYQAVKSKADEVLKLYSETMGSANKDIAMKTVTLAAGDFDDQDQVLEVAAWVDSVCGSNIEQTIRDDDCGLNDENKTYVISECKKWIRQSFNTDFYGDSGAQGVYLRFKQICDDAVTAVDGAWQALDDYLKKYENEFPEPDSGGQGQQPPGNTGSASTGGNNSGTGSSGGTGSGGTGSGGTGSGGSYTPPQNSGGGSGGTGSGGGGGGVPGGSGSGGGSGSTGGGSGSGGTPSVPQVPTMPSSAIPGGSGSGGTGSSGTGGSGAGGAGGEHPGGTMPSSSIPGGTGGGGAGTPGSPDSVGTNPITGQPLETDPETGEAYPIDPETGEPVKDGQDTMTVQKGDNKLSLSEPDKDGRMDISVDDGKGPGKDFKLDFGDGTAGGDGTGGTGGASTGDDGGFGPEGSKDSAQGADGEKVYTPGPDGKIHIQDGDLKITAEQPQGPDGPTVVTVDDGKGEPTTYTLGEKDADPSKMSTMDKLNGHGDTLGSSTPGHHAAASSAGHSGSHIPDSGGGSGHSGGSGGSFGGGGGDATAGAGSSGGGGFSGASSTESSLQAGAHSGAAVPQPATAGVASSPGGVGTAAPSGTGSGAMGGGMMGGMGAMGGGAGNGGGDQERGPSQYRVEGNIFETTGAGGRISGSLDDDGDRPMSYDR